MTTPTPSPDVRELAARTIHDRECRFRPDHHEMAGWCNDYADLADAVLAAVSPVIRRQVAEEIAEAISDNVRNEDWSKQDRGGFIGLVPSMAYVAGHDRAAAIARTHAHPEEGK